MESIPAIALYGLLFVGVLFLVSALSGLVRIARGVDDEAIERRLANPADPKARAERQRGVLQARTAASRWAQRIPYYARFLRLVQSSGVGATVNAVLAITAVIAVIAFVALMLLVPAAYMPFAAIAAGALSITIVVLHLIRARSKRFAKFQEQLPDAIDLIVRSLKVGHPLSGAMGVVGRELSAPIAAEFSTAFNEVTYGQDIPSAFAKMAERVPLADVGYLTMAVQIQQESGGNLVESLSKLSAVIRERFRMFRKVKALTAEGRFSAWFLSIFPFVVAVCIQLIKPDYYTQVMDFAYFPQLVLATIILLVINIVAMRVITALKV